MTRKTRYKVEPLVWDLYCNVMLPWSMYAFHHDKMLLTFTFWARPYSNPIDWILSAYSQDSFGVQTIYHSAKYDEQTFFGWVQTSLWVHTFCTRVLLTQANAASFVSSSKEGNIIGGQRLDWIGDTPICFSSIFEGSNQTVWNPNHRINSRKLFLSML